MQLTWPDELKPYLEQEAEKAGYASVDDFTLQTFLKANSSGAAEEDVDALFESGQLTGDELEREILAGINSGPATPMTATDWDELRKRVIRRIGSNRL